MVEQDQPRKYCYITEPIYFSEGEKHAYVVPYHGLRLTVTIDFPHPAIGLQKMDIDVNEQSFGRDIANARTFGFLRDVEALKARDAFEVYGALKARWPGASRNLLYALLAVQEGGDWREIARERRTEILLRLDAMGLAPR